MTFMHKYDTANKENDNINVKNKKFVAHSHCYFEVHSMEDIQEMELYFQFTIKNQTGFNKIYLIPHFRFSNFPNSVKGS